VAVNQPCLCAVGEALDEEARRNGGFVEAGEKVLGLVGGELAVEDEPEVAEQRLAPAAARIDRVERAGGRVIVFGKTHETKATRPSWRSWGARSARRSFVSCRTVPSDSRR